jgi:hypothetical protein
MKTDLKETFRYFTENHDEIFRVYPNKFVVLSDKSVVLAKDSFVEAYEAAIAAGYQPGSFLVQECTEGDSAYTQYFSSPIIAFA